jgi:hypothetical protein
MDIKKLIRENWKGVLTGAAIAGATAFGGPIAGKAAGFIVPKALDRVAPEPVVVKPEPQVIELRLSARERAMLSDVARDWQISGRLSCTVVEK